MDRDGALKQARQLLSEAEKCQKTTMFRWKPDWEGASVAYDKAALQFKLAKDLAKSKEVFLLACNAHKQYGALFHAAKALEGAAGVAKDMKSHADAAELTIQASHLYREHGTPDAACTALDKAAKACVTSGNEEQAIELYYEIFDIRHDEDRPRQCKEPIQKALQLCLRHKKYDRAAELSVHQVALMLELNNNDLYAKSLLTAVVIALLRGDYVAAEKLYEDIIKRNPAVAHSDESKLADQIMSAFDEGDDEKLAVLTKNRLLTFIDNEVALAAERITVPGGGRSADVLSKGATDPPARSSAAAATPVIADPIPEPEPVPAPEKAPEPEEEPAAAEPEEEPEAAAEPDAEPAAADQEAGGEDDEDDDEFNLC